jgi:multidrug resistance efflux pump
VENQHLQTMIETKENELAFARDRLELINIGSQIRVLEVELDAIRTQLRGLVEEVKSERQALSRARELLALGATTRPQVEGRERRVRQAEAEQGKAIALIQEQEMRLEGLRERQQFLQEKFASEGAGRDSADATLLNLKLQVVQNEGRLAALRGRQRNGRVIAKHEGRISNFLAAVDAFVQPGDHLLRVARTRQTYIKAYVSPDNLSAFSNGTRVWITSGRQRWPGVVFDTSDEMSSRPTNLRTPFRADDPYNIVGIRLEDEARAPELFKKIGYEVGVRLNRWWQ